MESPFIVVDPGPEFAQLLVKHNGAMFRYVLTLLPRRLDAEEVMQRTTVILWQRFGEYDRNRDFLPWALKWVYFEVLNYRKEFARGKLFFREDIIDQLVESRPEYDEIHELRMTALRTCLENVKADGIELLRRRYCDSSTIAELAEEWRSTAKSLYRRLDRLRAALSDCVHNRLLGQTHD